MKAISLWQPWASAMALGFKRVETRHWPTKYFGPIAIHAAKRWTNAEKEFVRDVLRPNGITIPYTLPLGAIVATGTIVECRPTERVAQLLAARNDLKEYNLGDYTPGRWGWLFADVRPLAVPIPFKGAQGFFDVPDDLLRSHDWSRNRFSGGVEYFRVGDREEVQCARCGSSVDFYRCDECDHGFVENENEPDIRYRSRACEVCNGRAGWHRCCSTPEYCEANPLPGRELLTSSAAAEG